MQDQETYRADLATLAIPALLLGMPLLILIYYAFQTGFPQAQARGLLDPDTIALVLFFPLAPVAWLSRYRLVFGETCLKYRSWSWREVVIPYSQIVSVEASRVTPIARAPVSTHINLTTGSFVVVYTKAFSQAAIQHLYSLGQAHGPNNSFKPKPLRGSA